MTGSDRKAGGHMTEQLLTLILIMTSFIGCGINGSQERRRPMQNLNLNEPVLEKWLTYCWSVPEEMFVPVEAHPKLLFRPLQESNGALGVFLKEEVDPFRGVEGVRWKAHAAEPSGIDLLKSVYQAAGLQVEITASRNFVIVKLAKLNETLAKSKNKRDYVESLVRVAMKTDSLDHHWKFQLPADLETSGDPQLISNAGAPTIKELASRHDRADILLLSGSVYFIFYKKVDQLVDFLPDAEWFSPEARAAIKTTQRR
jgi:hypothetical protein